MNYRIGTYISIAVAAIGLGACTSSHSKVATPAAQPYTYTSAKGLSHERKALLDEAVSWVGTPYKYGGAEKGEGTDCSGFVLRVYLDVTQIKMPRSSAQQWEFCTPLKPSHIHCGDLVFFATGSDPEKVSHVGMMLDSESFIHSSSSKGVIVTPLSSPWWNARIIGYGKVPGMK